VSDSHPRPVTVPADPSGVALPGARKHERLANYPPVSEWDDHVAYDAKAHPRKVAHRYMLVPTICFNCESGCGLLAYVDREDLSIKKLEGNPAHPGSRGRNCAKGPATINQINDPERILYPLKRTGERGGGQWRRVSWDEALDDIAGRIRQAILEDRRDEIMYHIGRPGENAFTSGRCRPGGSTATTPTRTCARPGRGSGRRCGRGMTGRAPITPMPG
jgi:anaerobic selenocysteine-containing dehydrogenase